METWMLVVIVGIALVIVWYFTKKKTLDSPISRPIALSGKYTPEAAPGVLPQTGETPPAPPPPPPQNVPVASYQQAKLQQVAKTLIQPNALLQHVPFVGSTLSGIESNTRKVAIVTALAPLRTVTNTINNVTAHIPVVGTALAAPGKAVANVGNKVASFLGF
jgi:hypothetical protein